MIFCDLDGVLADFDKGHEEFVGYLSSKEADNVNWTMVEAVNMFYARLPLMPDARTLWNHIAPLKPAILTGLPHIQGAGAQKRAWVATHFGEDVPVFTCASSLKCLYCRPGDILIDDWEKYSHLWKAAGGRWITHYSALESIAQLRGMGYEI